MDKLLTAKEVAEILGISESTAKIWASKRLIPVVKVGRLIRISPYDLDEWIKKNTEMYREDTTNLKPKKPKEPHKSASFESFLKDLRKNRVV